MVTPKSRADHIEMSAVSGEMRRAPLPVGGCETRTILDAISDADAVSSLETCGQARPKCWIALALRTLSVAG